MTERYLLSIDPGGSSAAVLLSYTPKKAPALVKAWQFDGGAEAMRDWWDDHYVTALGIPTFATGNEGDEPWIYLKELTLICEAFTARATKNFSYTTASLEALPVIGVLVARALVDRNDKKRYVDPKFQYLVGGKDLVDKKKRQHAFLEDSGYYIGRKEIGRTLKDYDDARSATAHGIAWLARNRHIPSYELITKWSEANG